MHVNALTLTTLYTAFSELDAPGMAQCYADNARFDDPVFALRGKADIMAIVNLRMQVSLERGHADWRLEFCDIVADASTGTAHWNVHHRFGATGRMVLSHVDACFTFDDHGLITTPTDHFSFWVWLGQALGPLGWLLGWSPMLRNQVRRQAATKLQQFVASHSPVKMPIWAPLGN